MKSFAFAALFVGVAHGAACPPTELLKLTPIATNPNIPGCQADSGFTLIPPSGFPSPEQTAKMCKSQKCTDLIAAIKAVNPSDCDLEIGSVKLNVYKLVNEFEPTCKGTSPGPAPGPAPGPEPVTPAPSTPVTKPAC
jgi:hypothetical protein